MAKLSIKTRTSITLCAMMTGAFAAGNCVAAVDETNMYRLRLMTQTFDGAKEFSHTQEAGVARMRKGNESYTRMDFNDGAVVIEQSDKTNLGTFKNTTGAEAEFKYNYETNTLSGHNAVAPYFNTYIRPQLAGNPELGADAKWTKEMTLAEVGASVSSGKKLSLDLERKYFTHEGVDYALIRYAIPAFSYSSNDGVPVIHWGQGVALTDPGFGVIYWSATLHRAIAQNPGEEAARPYRYAKTIAAVGDDGSPLIDPRKIKEVSRYFDEYYAPTKTGVLPFVSEKYGVDQTPIVLAANLDQMALSIAENSPNQTGNTSGQNSNGVNGVEVATSALGLLDKVVAVGNVVEQQSNETKTLFNDKNMRTTNRLMERVMSFSDKTMELNKRLTDILVENDKLQDGITSAIDATEELAKKSGAFELLPDSAIKSLDQIEDNLVELDKIQKELSALDGERQTLSKVLKALPIEEFTDVMERFGNSKGGKALSVFSHVMNVNTVRVAGKNVYTASTTDLSSGDLPLTRKYGTKGAFADLMLDVAGMMANAVAGEKAAAVSDALALTSGSVGDLYISAKAKLDMDRREIEIFKEGLRLQGKLEELKSQKRNTEINEEIDSTRKELSSLAGLLEGIQNPEPWTIYHPNWDPKTNNWKPGTRQWKAEQAELAKLREKSSEPSKEDWDRFNKAMSELRDPYPKGPKYVQKNKPTPEQQYSDIPDWLKKEWEELPAKLRKAELDRYQEAKLQAQKEAYEQRQADRHQRILDMRDGPVTFDAVEFEPVVFEPVTWEPPVWEPPVWAPPEFDAPIQSIIEFTKFDGSEDDNWLGFASVVAYQYQNMSGIIETDLSKYEEFIALHGLRKLERLALQAGYPNLASALNDWENLVAKANDQGFRQWAGRAPVCYMACVNIQGQWTQKLSQLALGDILLDSRDLFSTAGLSDVSIGSLLLSIFINDFALEDGDAIRIIVSQFGREIFNSSFVLTNAGQQIDVQLRPGVAGVEITALNTGEFPPNTAAVAISGVTSGESQQAYSLDEGEQGVLRVNTGR